MKDEHFIKKKRHDMLKIISSREWEVRKMEKTVSIPENSIIEILKALPEDTLMDIISKVFMESDVSPLTRAERTSYKKAMSERERGETISWEKLR